VKLFLKILAVAVVLAVLCAAGFLAWGERFERLYSQDACAGWFRDVRPVAWLIAIGLLLADLVLPVPATGVMAALGRVYGIAVGALISSAGSMLAGLAGYGLARLAGRRGTRLLASDAEIERFGRFFDRWGGAAIIVSRWLPILPEVMTVMAGLARMRFGRFVVALALGAVPVSIVFAVVGALSAERPAWGIAFAVIAPLALWPVFLRAPRTTRRR
jgi:uncharacterized membrane protein YdjX (TVP38/TMEM64 family)